MTATATNPLALAAFDKLVEPLVAAGHTLETTYDPGHVEMEDGSVPYELHLRDGGRP
jgi:hypothetical protein